MRIFLGLLLLAAVAAGDVFPSSLRRTDMEFLDATIADYYTGVNVKCVEIEGSTVLAMVVPDLWTCSTRQLGQLGFLLGVSGAFTAQTSWHSDMCFIIYDDIMFYCTTAAARELASGVDDWTEDQLLQWIGRNLSSELI